LKAAVCYQFGQPLVIEDLRLDPPQAGEVRVRIKAVAICHSDVNLVRGHWQGWSADVPVVAGHEAAGLVAEVGPGAILGERALLEGGTRTATLMARTKCRVAVAPGDSVDRAALAELSEGHRREER